MTEDEGQEAQARELWQLAQQAVREAFARPTEACPNVMQLLRYARSLMGQQDQDQDISEGMRAIGRHKAFCGYCTRRYRWLQAALVPTMVTEAEAKVKLLLRPLLKATDDIAGRLLQELGEWLAQAIDKGLKPLAAPVTLGPVRTRGATAQGKERPEVRAQLLDRDGRPTGELVIMQLERGPEIEQGRFVLRLRTSESRYEGYEARVALEPEEGFRVELGTAPIRQGSVSITTEVGGLGLEFEPVIPLHLLALTLQPK